MYKQTHGLTDTWTYRHTDIQTDTCTNTHMDLQTEPLTHRHTDRPHKQTDLQTNGHRDKRTLDPSTLMILYVFLALS